MEKRHNIFAATGPDRPGVMDDVSLFLYESGANILDSRVCILRGRFAILLHISGDEKTMRAVEGGLAGLGERAGLRAELQPASDGPSSSSSHLKLHAAGTDQAGVVHKLSHLMRVLNVNIDNVETHVDEGDGGHFELEMDLAVPRETPLVMLKQYVESLSKEIGIECQIGAM
ncbi:MAG: glycine cleavage system protein R [Tepidisphaeraceae bacterium]